MDLISKGAAWARSVCDKLEAMCFEEDDNLFKHVEQEDDSQHVLLAPSLDEVKGCKSVGKAGEANGSGDDISLPISDEVEGCTAFGITWECSNLVNAIPYPSSGVLSSRSDTCSESIEGLNVNLTHGDALYAVTVDNTAGIATAPTSETELSHYGFEANKFAEPELSVSIPENGNSGVPSKATIQPTVYVKLDDVLCMVNNEFCSACNAATHIYCEVDAPQLQSLPKETIQASNYARIDDCIVMKSNKCGSADCEAANHRYCEKPQASETMSEIEEDEKLKAEDDAAGSDEQNDDDMWESEWVIV